MDFGVTHPIPRDESILEISYTGSALFMSPEIKKLNH